MRDQSIPVLKNKATAEVPPQQRPATERLSRQSRVIEEAPAIKFRCTACGFCCRGYTPLITAGDASRLQEKLRRPLSSFVEFYRPEDFDVPLLDDERMFVTRHGPLVMGLARRNDECVFLKNSLCTIHTIKPGLCRAFPFQPVASGDIEGPFEMQNDPCHGQHGMDQLVAHATIRQDYVSFIYDYYQYVERVSSWNLETSSRAKDLEDFLLYMGLEWQLCETT